LKKKRKKSTAKRETSEHQRWEKKGNAAVRIGKIKKISITTERSFLSEEGQKGASPRKKKKESSGPRRKKREESKKRKRKILFRKRESRIEKKKGP